MYVVSDLKKGFFVYRISSHDINLKNIYKMIREVSKLYNKKLIFWSDQIIVVNCRAPEFGHNKISKKSEIFFRESELLIKLVLTSFAFAFFKTRLVLATDRRFMQYSRIFKKEPSRISQHCVRRFLRYTDKIRG